MIGVARGANSARLLVRLSVALSVGSRGGPGGDGDGDRCAPTFDAAQHAGDGGELRSIDPGEVDPVEQLLGRWSRSMVEEPSPVDGSGISQLLPWSMIDVWEGSRGFDTV